MVVVTVVVMVAATVVVVAVVVAVAIRRRCGRCGHGRRAERGGGTGCGDHHQDESLNLHVASDQKRELIAPGGYKYQPKRGKSDIKGTIRLACRKPARLRWVIVATLKRQMAVATALAVTGLLPSAFGPGTPAWAQLAQPTVVSANPVDYTPHVLDGTVFALAQAADLIVAGGDFTSVADAAGQFVLARGGLFAFSRADGRINNLAVAVDGPIYAVAEGPQRTVYIGGHFRTVNGEPHRGIAQVRIDDGSVVSSFGANIDFGEVRVLRQHDGWLYAGGSFKAISGVARKGLARLDLRGRVDTGFDAQLEESPGLQVKVNDVALTSDGHTLVAIGGFAQAQGQARYQVAVFAVDAKGAALSTWDTNGYQPKCSHYFENYVRGVDISPDNRYMVIVTTGHRNDPNLLCNTAARFDLGGEGAHNPVWVNHTGGNTLLSVAITGPAVYVGGHQMWLDNPEGHKSAGPGAVERPGISAIDPVRGTALGWNPTRTRGVGLRAFLATNEGLYVGSDTDQLGGEYHGRIGMFPMH